ncbi:polyhydroxyalkanoic acid system family protein [Rhodoplanes sp. Z2-YC6860]|uniref:polyhydroxyalkanoic acid system family protein n=1 Tax=Rhodoplanes sp. Z2-YC6860 TaxID=674703 RepID=UPI00078D4BDF|nr:polyhydroxyalkanoic acid system family protein [Rhodoplanes sp. Z2-YC6860]AMN44089.1 polyhydroxyalkanoic acid system protein [Rhodoplanes sp. Z2-YC6860]
MTKPLVVCIPHRLGKDKAIDRLKGGLDRAARDFKQVITIEQQVWTGDSLSFHIRAVGQFASGNLQVFENFVRLEVTLPWLLAKLAERLAPALEQQGKLLLEHK